MDKLNIFLGYSILGYIYEIVVNLLFHKKPISGIMRGPWTPIYGFGVLIMLFVRNVLEDFHLNKIYELIFFFIIMIIILTVMEQLGGILLDKVFHKTLWDYSDLKFHITKYIALEVSLIWGLASILITYVIHPLISKLLDYIPGYITIMVFIIFLIDAITTFINSLK